jgi:hypothetical protein
MQTCPLCLNKATLQLSHVIPNSFFKRLKKNGGRPIESDMRDESPLYYTQESWSEKILCRDCEQRINEYDSYIAAFTYNPKRVKVKVLKLNNGQRLFSNVDYKKLRLFQLSLLFRANFSKHDSYQHIKLISNDIQDIRESIFNNNPFSDHQLGCQMRLLWYKPENRPFNDYIAVPLEDIHDKKEIVYFAFGGFSWEFHLPKFNYKQIKQGYFVKPNGVLKVPVVNDVDYEPVRNAIMSANFKDNAGLNKT